MRLKMGGSGGTGGGRMFPGDEEFLSGVREAHITEATPKIAWALYLMLSFIVLAIVWAATTTVDQITKADGRVVPDGREQVIASLEGGILRELFVQEGELVEKGQDLLQLDPTRVEAQQAEGSAKRLGLKATIARLEAEAYGKPLQFPDEVAENEQLLQSERDAFIARRQALDEAVAVNRRSLTLIERELAMSERFAAKGLLSEVEVMRLRRQANDLTLQIQERINRFRQDASTDLTRVQTELAQLEEQLVVKRDVLTRTVLKSPVQGVVKRIRIGTLGGIVQGGTPILEIVPVGERVLVEARIKPGDVGFIHVGLPAEIKLAAYDYYTFGGLKGTIEYLSPDALKDDGASGPQDTSYYRTLIRTDISTLRAGGKALSVIPGMTGTVEIRTGERTVLEFLLRPVMKSREAFRER